jgi:exodeoxyribonuclease V beta subunit
VGLPQRRAGKDAPGANQLHLGALGHLLCAGETVTPDQAEALLDAWTRAQPDTSLQRVDAGQRPPRWQRPAQADAALRLHDYAARFERDWGVGSFSALVRDLEAPVPGDVDTPGALAWDDAEAQAERIAASAPSLAPERQADALRVERWREELLGEPLAGPQALVETPEPQAALAADVTAQPWHRFPKGALPGNFLHDQLEWLAQEGEACGSAFADPADPAIRSLLRRRCERGGFGGVGGVGGERAEEVAQWLERLLHTPLPPLGVPLRSLPARLAEMEFWMPAQALDRKSVV